MNELKRNSLMELGKREAALIGARGRKTGSGLRTKSNTKCFGCLTKNESRMVDVEKDIGGLQKISVNRKNGLMNISGGLGGVLKVLVLDSGASDKVNEKLEISIRRAVANEIEKLMPPRKEK